MKRFILFFITAIFYMPVITKAQTDFSLGADLVSSYMWRGVAVAGTSIQPSMKLTTGGFSIEAWGSVDIAGNGYKEINFLSEYNIGNFTVGLSDYWWNGEGAFDFLHFDKDSGSHVLETSLAYTFGFGLKLKWSTIFAGAGDKYLDDNGKLKKAYSSYLEVGYSFKIQDVELMAMLGVSPWRSNVMHTKAYPYATDGFAVTDISLKASKAIAITDKFSLPVFGHLAFNPATEDIFFIFGLSF